MATDTRTPKLIINDLTKEQFEAITNPSDTELYLVPDDTDEKLALKQDKLTAANAGDNVTITEVDGTLKISATGGGSGSSTLAGLTDTTISSPTNAQALVYDATTQKWKNGNVTATGVLAENVGYTYGDFTSVKEALDSLLYKGFTLSVSGGGAYEAGGSVTNPKITWSYNPTTVALTSQQVKNGDTVLSSSTSIREYTYNGTINSATTLKVIASDGTSTKDGSASFTFSSLRRYYGSSSSNTISSADIIDSSKMSSSLSTSRAMSGTLNCTGGKYGFIVIPTTYCTNIAFKLMGWDYTFPASDIETRTITTRTGQSLSVNIYRTPKYTSDSVSFQVL